MLFTKNKHRALRLTKTPVMLFCTTLFLGCQSAPSDRYAQKHDSAPRYVAKQPETLDAVPKYEAYRMHNSRPYSIFGKHYIPMVSGKGYEETGYASWYGQKFHGHLTSNGETYNMFAMSAAHKTLPLPSYVRVTNLENNKQAIVRINDRGPFHDNRIIDLSYAAAVKLGYHNKGTTKVKLEVIHFDRNNNVTIGSAPTLSYDEYIDINVTPTYVNRVDKAVATAASTDRETLTVNKEVQQLVTLSEATDAASTREQALFIQVAALSDAKKAKAISNVLSALYQIPAHLPKAGRVYKLQLGPIFDEEAAAEVLQQLRQNGYPSAYALTQTL